MDWLDAFDPASASSRARSASTQQPPGPSRAGQSSTHAPSSSQHPVPAITRPPRPSHAARPPQRFSTRTPAAPPSAALRSEDAQPNEYQIRLKPWEMATPPSIGASRSKSSQPAGGSLARSQPRPAMGRPPTGRQPVSRPTASYPGQTQSKKRPAPHQQHNRPSRSQRNAMHQQSAMQHHQQAPTPQQPPSGQSSSSKPKPKSEHEAIISSHLKYVGQAPPQSQNATPKSITVHDINSEIPLWTEDAKYQAEKSVAIANLRRNPPDEIRRIREELAPLAEEQRGRARRGVADRFANPLLQSAATCLALCNYPQLALRLLHIRVELYRCAALLVPSNTAPRKHAFALVKHVRNALTQILGLAATDIDSSTFCSKEQILRPEDPIIVDTLDRIRDTDDVGLYAIAVLTNLFHIFGGRIIHIDWHDVDRWKQQHKIKSQGAPRPDVTTSVENKAVPAPVHHASVRQDTAASDEVRTPSAPPSKPVQPMQAAAHDASVARDTAASDEIQKPSAPPTPPIQPTQKDLEAASVAVTVSVADPEPPKDHPAEPAQPTCAEADNDVQAPRSPRYDIRTPTPPPSMLAQHGPCGNKHTPEVQRDPRSRSRSASPRKFGQLKGVLSAIDLSPRPSSLKPPTLKTEQMQDAMLEEARQAQELAILLEARQPNADDNDDESDDDQPLAMTSHAPVHTPAATQAGGTDSDPDEDVPLQDLLRRQSPSAATALAASSSTSAADYSASHAFQSAVWGLDQARAFSSTRGLSIKHFVPLASAALGAQTGVRNRASAFDSGLGVTDHGRIATFSEAPSYADDAPSRVMELQTRDAEAKLKADKAWPIDRVEDVWRLTSKVCGIASSTRKLLGMGRYDEYPCQVSLVTMDETGRAHRTYHLDERPHVHGAAAMSHFPRTDPNDASSIDFATGGIDGIVNHWHWRARSTSADTQRLHTLHDAKPVVALEHLSSRAQTLASASMGTVIGFDLGALTLGFSWNTSDCIVHLQRTPDAKLMLGVLARRDYDQFRMFDITGANGPISRPVISFGWLNDAEGKLPLGRGAFHPSRRAIFAHGAEDGHVRVWDLRNARDPLVDLRVSDEPIVQAFWANSGQQDADVLYAATPRGVRTIAWRNAPAT
ncbi:hypothetical protein PANT_25c00008 [Moesziomyces antarcticus T-34]|uniref:WD40 repeat-like protein n=1 Tax=Pseudozyma antarctica (strain T-34) TaxID=1151754 RepID=M9LSU9_PSEA3|nr:hypothetical protein PANT_25c00008 [Moesziomyces antarcticus T-34]